MQAIQNKSARMNDLIHLLFEYVKLDSEGFSLDRKKETDLSELLRENLCKSFMQTLKMQGWNSRLIFQKKWFRYPLIQSSFQVITNLLNNAMKHNESGTHI